MARPRAADRARVRAAEPARPRGEEPSRSGGAALTAALALAAALLAAWAQRGALSAFFTTDDLILFERVRGLASFPPTLWRVIPGRVWFEVLFPAFGTDPSRWHAAVLALHAVAAALVVVWARRLGARPEVALFAAALFACTARARAVVWPASGAGEALALIATLAALIAFASAGSRVRNAGVVLHALALLCKETVALVPAVAMLGRGDRGRRAAPLVALALSVAFVAYLVASRAQLGSLGGEAYAAGFGPHVMSNLIRYTAWAFDLPHAIEATAAVSGGWAATSLVLLAALLAYAWRSGSLVARAGLALWAAWMLPVLALVNAQYEHYVYGATAGFALALGDALAAAVRGVAHRAGAPASRATAAAIVALASVALLHVITAQRSYARWDSERVASGLLRDSFLRRMEVARNAALTLQRQLGPERARLVIYQPESTGYLISSRTGERVAAPRGAARYDLVPGALDQGRGLRALLPQLEDVRFSEHVEPRDAGAIVATVSPLGQIQTFGVGPEAHVALADFWAAAELPDDARTHLGEALALYSGSRAIRARLFGPVAPVAGGESRPAR